MTEHIGTVISTPNSPSPSNVDFVVTNGIVHRGQFVEIKHANGTMLALVTNVMKTNKYFERADSVKEFEARGSAIFEQFPTAEWEYIVANTRPLGIFTANGIKRPSTPPSPGTKVFSATKELLNDFYGFDDNGLHLGRVEFHGLDVNLNMTRLLKKHLAILSISGAGKCVSPSSRVLLGDGRSMEIGKLVEQHLAKQKVLDGNTEISYSNPKALEIFSLGEGNRISSSKIIAFTRRKAPRQMLRIYTKSGRTLEVTPEHPIPIMSGFIEWVPASELREHDFLLIARPKLRGSNQRIDFFDLWKDSTRVRVKNRLLLNLIRKKLRESGPLSSFARACSVSCSAFRNWFYGSGIPLAYFKKLCDFAGLDFNQLKGELKTLHCGAKKIPAAIHVNEDFAKLFGYMLAEGHNSGKHISFTNTSPKIQADFAKLCQRVFGEKACRLKRADEVRIYNKLLAETLQKIGFTKSSWTKFVPSELMMSEEKVISAFLSSFFDCDGYVSLNKPEVKICLASEQLSEHINQFLLRFGIIAFKRIKRVNSRPYVRLLIRGSQNLSILRENLNLLIDMKGKRLTAHTKKQSNPNLDTIPNITPLIKKLLVLLRIKPNQMHSEGLSNYLHRADSPSSKSMRLLLKSFEKRFTELQLTIDSVKTLFRSLPAITENEAKVFVTEAYENFNFNQIACNTGVSCTTARRVSMGITNPKNSVFKLAENALALQGTSNTRVEIVNKLDFSEIASEIKRLCEKLNFSTQELCIEAGVWKRALYEYSSFRRNPCYSSLRAIAKSLFEESLRIERGLQAARELLDYIKSIVDSNIYFDQITKIETFRPKYKYVYDLCVENHNFICNDLIIHNSYLTSCILEELLDRKKEQGRIACIILDPHGEYSSFAEPPEHGCVDYSDRTMLVKGNSIK
ncbi:hypothetical protein J7L85_02540, partial [candidate division WOR-3 bacterium]|nr:hypothetical protein [candidate division WOR-3 bacterium]